MDLFNGWEFDEFKAFFEKEASLKFQFTFHPGKSFAEIIILSVNDYFKNTCKHIESIDIPLYAYQQLTEELGGLKKYFTPNIALAVNSDMIVLYVNSGKTEIRPIL